jgi:dTDP-4-amino-4,6-dideoxygalactose transaminase
MFPNTEAAGASLLALPFHSRLSGADVDRVCTVLLEEVHSARVLR